MQRGRFRTARVGVLTIIDEEFEETSRCLGTTDEIRGTPYWTRPDGTLDVVIRQAADRANVPAVEPVRDLIEDFRPEVVFVVGIAGGVIGEGRRPGDVMVANYLHYADFRKLTGGQDRRRFWPYDQPSVNLREIHVDAARRRPEWRERIVCGPPETVRAPRVFVGSIVAGEKIMGDPSHAEQRKLLADFDEAIGIDMESAGAARAVHGARRAVDYNVGLVIVRGVSDMVNADALEDRHGCADEQDRADERDQRLADQNSEQRASWKRYAAGTAAAFAAEITERILATPDLRGEMRADEAGA